MCRKRVGFDVTRVRPAFLRCLLRRKRVRFDALLNCAAIRFRGMRRKRVGFDVARVRPAFLQCLLRRKRVHFDAWPISSHVVRRRG